MRSRIEPSSNYIKSKTPAARSKYAQTMESLKAQASQLEEKVGDQQILELLLGCLSKLIANPRNLHNDPPEF